MRSNCRFSAHRRGFAEAQNDDFSIGAELHGGRYPVRVISCYDELRVRDRSGIEATRL